MKKYKNRILVLKVFGSLRDNFLSRLTGLNYTSASIATYRNSVNRFLKFLEDHGVGEIQEADIKILEKYRLMLLEKKLKSRSVNTYLKGVRFLFKYLEEKGMIFINPSEELQNVKMAKELPFVPSVELVEKLLKQPDTTTPIGIRNRAIIETLYSTAVRKTELISMNMDDIDWINSTVKVFGKGRKERMVPIGTQAKKWIDEYLEGPRKELLQGEKDDALWICFTGERITGPAVQVTLKNYCFKANIKPIISSHALRRACATHMLQNGANPVEIQMLLGHARLKTLSHYLKINISELKNTHENSRLGK